MKKNILIMIIITMIFIIGCEKSKPKPKPKFKNGDIVIHSVTGFKGQIIDNKYSYYSNKRSWKVKAYFYPYEIDVNNIEQIKSKKYNYFKKVSEPMHIYEFELKLLEEKEDIYNY